jgi:hypothetical protein
MFSARASTQPLRGVVTAGGFRTKMPTLKVRLPGGTGRDDIQPKYISKYIGNRPKAESGIAQVARIARAQSLDEEAIASPATRPGPCA